MIQMTNSLKIRKVFFSLLLYLMCSRALVNAIAPIDFAGNSGFKSKVDNENHPSVRRKILNQKIQNRLDYKEKIASRQKQMKELARKNSGPDVCKNI
jgi:hypothetical protein